MAAAKRGDRTRVLASSPCSHLPGLSSTRTRARENTGRAEGGWPGSMLGRTRRERGFECVGGLVRMLVAGAYRCGLVIFTWVRAAEVGSWTRSLPCSACRRRATLIRKEILWCFILNSQPTSPFWNQFNREAAYIPSGTGKPPLWFFNSTFGVPLLAYPQSIPSVLRQSP